MSTDTPANTDTGTATANPAANPAANSAADAFGDFVALVRRNLDKNGFPGNAVTLPLERMYEEADKRGFSFNRVREALAAQGVVSRLTDDRAVFEPKPSANPTSPLADMWGAGMGGADAPAPGAGAEGDLFTLAQRMFSRMSAAERDKLTRMMGEMDPSALERMQREFESMPPEEKARLYDRMAGSMPDG